MWVWWQFSLVNDPLSSNKDDHAREVVKNKCDGDSE